MKNKRGDDRFCECIRYRKIEAKKLERLQKNRQRQMCTWKDIAPFSERQKEFLAATARVSHTTNKPLFPPIHELPCITNHDTYKAMYNTGNSGEIIADELRSNIGRVGEENGAIFQHYGCGCSSLKDNNIVEEESRCMNSEVKGSRNSAEPQSSRLKLPKITNFSFVNQRL